MRILAFSWGADTDTKMGHLLRPGAGGDVPHCTTTMVTSQLSTPGPRHTVELPSRPGVTRERAGGGGGHGG